MGSERLGSPRFDQGPRDSNKGYIPENHGLIRGAVAVKS